MTMSARSFRHRHFHQLSTLVVILFAVFTTTTLRAAELHPFPPPDRESRFEQSAPQYREPRPSPNLEQFRRDLSTFPCQELHGLRERIRGQRDAAEPLGDRDYYDMFLNLISNEISRRCE